MPSKTKHKKLSIYLNTPMGMIPVTNSMEDKGSNLFNKFVRSMGIDEFWYFSLQAKALGNGNEHMATWMSMDTPIHSQNLVIKPHMPVALKCRFYPDDVDNVHFELTRRMLFCQMVQEISSNTTFCPPELHALMCSFAAQAFYGNYSERLYNKEMMKKIVGKSDVPRLLKKNAEEYEKILVTLYKRRNGISRSDATAIYLKLASDLDLYGSAQLRVQTVTNSMMTVMLDSAGIRFYPLFNSIEPKVVFHWGEFKSVSAVSTKITLSFYKDKQSMILRTSNPLETRWLLTEIMAYQTLYTRWANPELPEMEELRRKGRQTRQDMPSTDTTVTYNGALEEDAHFRRLAKEPLSIYDESYTKQKEIFMRAEYMRKCMTRSVEEQKRKVEEAHLKYKNTVSSGEYFKFQTDLCKHHVATLARTKLQNNKNITTKKQEFIREQKILEQKELKLEDYKVMEEEELRKKYRHETPPMLWLHQCDLSTLNQTQGITYSFGPESRRNRMPWQHREPLYMTDQNLKAELETLYKDFGSLLGDRSLHSKTLGQQDEFYRSGSNKYRIFREIAQKNLGTRIQTVHNWSNDTKRASLMNDEDLGIPNGTTTNGMTDHHDDHDLSTFGNSENNPGTSNSDDSGAGTSNLQANGDV